MTTKCTDDDDDEVFDSLPSSFPSLDGFPPHWGVPPPDQGLGAKERFLRDIHKKDCTYDKDYDESVRPLMKWIRFNIENDMTGEEDTCIYQPDRRITSIIAISPPSYYPNFINKQSALTIAVPMMLTTGTEDIRYRV